MYLEQGLSFSRIEVVYVLLPLEEGVLVDDVQLIAVDKGAQQDAVGKAGAVGPNLKVTTCTIMRCKRSFGQAIFPKLWFLVLPLS